MLIGSSSKRPSLQAVRRIKHALGEALDLPEDAILTVTQLACLEEDCAPLETVIGLLRSGAPQLQFKVHKPTEAIDAADLLEACQSWGFSAEISTLESKLKEI